MKIKQALAFVGLLFAVLIGGAFNMAAAVQDTGFTQERRMWYSIFGYVLVFAAALVMGMIFAESFHNKESA